MHPILFKIGFINIYTYGLMVAIGFSLATILSAKEAGRRGISSDDIISLSLVVLITGLIGARLLYVILNLGIFIARPIEIFMISHGGLVFYGGAVSSFICGIIYLKKKRLDILKVLDIISPFVALGHSIGRIGCFFNGCCYGRPIYSFFGYKLHKLIIHPTQIYSSLYLLLLYVLLRFQYKHQTFRGQVFYSYLLLYTTGRFLIEELRGDQVEVFLGMTLSQLISIVVFFIAVFLYIRKRWQLRT